MDELAGTTLTVLLFVAAFLGCGAYAVLSMADLRAARRGFGATAFSFAAIGLVLGTMTTWPLSTRIIVCAVFMAVSGGSLVWILDYLKIREALGIENTQTETGRLVSQAQFGKVTELEALFGGKDENDLRQLFDLPTILQKNINTQIIRIGFIKSGREKDFLYSNYTDNGSWIMWAKEGHYSTGPSGVHVEAGPKDVLYLVTTNKFQMAQKKIVEFINSALVPQPIKLKVSEFNKAIAQDTELMMKILDSKMHEDENYFLKNMEMDTPYYGVIVTAFATQMTPLKPAADGVLSAIAESWKISK